MSDSAYSLYAAAEREQSPERAMMLRRAASEAPIIRSQSLHPDQSPDRAGQVVLKRVLANTAWPAGVVAPGAVLTVLDQQGWLWMVEVDEVLPTRTDARNGWDTVESARATVHGPRLASPMPAPIERDGKLTLALPNMGGHAHVRSWRKGDVVRIGADTYKILSEKVSSGGSSLVYTLTAADPEDYDTRPGRIKMPGEREARRAVGSAVQKDNGDWLHVSKVEKVAHRAQYLDYTWYAVGKHCSAEAADRINAAAPGPLQAALAAVHGEIIAGPMPADAAVLIPADPTSRAATGERLALVGKIVLHERTGDPDQSDSWRHYIVQITDPALVARVKIFLRKAKAKKGAAS